MNKIAVLHCLHLPTHATNFVAKSPGIVPEHETWRVLFSKAVHLMAPFTIYHFHFRFLITQKSWAQNGAQSRAGEISASAIASGLTYGLGSWTDRTQAIKTRQDKST